MCENRFFFLSFINVTIHVKGRTCVELSNGGQIANQYREEVAVARYNDVLKRVFFCCLVLHTSLTPSMVFYQ